MSPLDAFMGSIGDIVAFPITPLGSVTVGVLVWALAAVLSLGCSLAAWIEARLDLVIFQSAHSRYQPYEFAVRRRQLQRNTRNDEIAVEAQFVLLAAAILAGIAQVLNLGTLATHGPFTDFAPLLFAVAEIHMAIGSLRNLFDRKHDDRQAAALHP